MHMHVLAKQTPDGKHHMFLRPTPWLVAWQAFGAFLSWQKTYVFMQLPPEQARLGAQSAAVQAAASAPHPMTWALWIHYVIESWLSGLLLRFWHWRWSGMGDVIK